MVHSFDVSIAMLKSSDGKIIGTDCAIFLQDMAFWCDYNKSSSTNFYDGRFWTFCTMDGLCERHPYWTKNQLRRVIDKCKNSGYLLTGNYNKSAYDRTMWYSVSDEIMTLSGVSDSNFECVDSTSSICGLSQMEIGKTTFDKCAKPHLTSVQNHTPIPDSIQDNRQVNNKDNNPPTHQIEDLGFGDELSAAFTDWLAYKREKRQGYKPTGLKSLVTQVQKHAQQYGETAVATLIRECMAANWQGIIWDKLTHSSGNRTKKATCSDYGLPETAGRLKQDMDELEKFAKGCERS